MSGAASGSPAIARAIALSLNLSSRRQSVLRRALARSSLLGLTVGIDSDYAANTYISSTPRVSNPSSGAHLRSQSQAILVSLNMARAIRAVSPQRGCLKSGGGDTTRTIPDWMMSAAQRAQGASGTT